MKRSIASEVGLDTMYAMRREGMSNQAIADALGVTAQTVYRSIGKQPRELRKKRERVEMEKPREEVQHEACLVVKSRILRVEGACATYHINLDKQTMHVMRSDSCLSNVEIEDIPAFISELDAIYRNASSMKAGNEMW